MLTGQSLRKSFGELDQDAAVRRIGNPVEGDDEPQAFKNVEVDLIFTEQPQQSLCRWFAIVCAHA